MENEMGDTKNEKKSKCLRCGGLRTETEYYQREMGGGSRETYQSSRQVTCKACGGRG